jgi:hypothetical protein
MPGSDGRNGRCRQRCDPKAPDVDALIARNDPEFGRLRTRIHDLVQRPKKGARPEDLVLPGGSPVNLAEQ